MTTQMISRLDWSFHPIITQITQLLEFLMVNLIAALVHWIVETVKEWHLNKHIIQLQKDMMDQRGKDMIILEYIEI